MIFPSVKFSLEKNISSHHKVPHGGLYSDKLGDDPRFIDFSSNVNPIGFPSSITKIINNRKLFSVYPDPDSSELRKTIQKSIGINEDQIVVGNGATEIIYNFCRAFLNKNSNVLIPIPTFGEYEAASRLSDAKITFLKTMNLNENIPEIQDQMAKTKCIFVCNPNNPTGVLIQKNKMLKIVESAYDKSVFVFLDECFIELVPYSDESLITKLKEFDNLFILRSLTKSFGLAGLRVGYGLGHKKIIDVLQKIKIPWNVNAIAQKAASKAITNLSHLRKTRQLIKQELEFLTRSISQIDGFTCYDSSTNFILIKSKIDSTKIQEKLLKKKILIRDCSNFRGLDNKFIRIAVRTHKENVILVRALANLT